MEETTFFRVLKAPIDDKGDVLAEQVTALNKGGDSEGAFTNFMAEFSKISGSPFAYWAVPKVFTLFGNGTRFDSAGYMATKGLATTDDFQFLRLSWEPDPSNSDWKPFAKGGAFSPYYAGIGLSINWSADGKGLKDYLDLKIAGNLGANQWSRWINGLTYYFLPGLTWPSRTNGFSVRVMPEGCIFGHKAAVAFCDTADQMTLLALLAIMNSVAFGYLVQIQLARTELARSYEVGLIQQTPVPILVNENETAYTLSRLALEACRIQRYDDELNETAHIFRLPSLTQNTEATLSETSIRLDQASQSRQTQLAAVQREIDDLAFDLYGLDTAERAAILAETSSTITPDAESASDEDDEAEEMVAEDPTARVQNLLMWCVGVAFGRWDVRMALDPSLLPALQGPFDPLPRCAPGALVGIDALPPASASEIAPAARLRARGNVLDVPPAPQAGDAMAYPLPIAWDGILVDDENHPADIVRRVEQVITLLWGERGDAIIQEACAILGVPDLRSYFRDARQGFYAFHIKRYSKSRRKAPIYWLLQSEKRNYGIWLYYHRLRTFTLLEAARKPYADTKVMLEEARLEEFQQSLAALSGAPRKQREREIERQQKLVAEVTTFRDLLDKVAALQLPPDHNDGVILSIAPLHPLTPWKEAEKMWRQLVAGEYPWSTMSQQMRKRGLLKK